MPQQQANYTGYSIPSYSNQPMNQYGSWAAQNPYNQPQPQYEPQPQQQQQSQTQQVKSQRVWVMGESSAKAYIVGNNTEQVLWDSEQPVIYIKTVDITGRPSTVILDYTIRNPKTEDDQNEITALKAEFSELKDMMKQFMSQKQTYKPNYKNKGGED